ncbi:MAG: Asp23/Gls24 family envelope stress response protein [Lachnospiraceae bacterium]|nr:Asp23/Gls24 family envelope stress response protein [Lachnospiraceae bacterium]
MDKEMDKNTYVLQEENTGTVKIADDVVAMIAGLAATEVEGVSAMAGNVTNELMSKVGMKKLTKGVKVDVFDRHVTVDLAILMEYGYNIPTTCQKVQAKVKAAIENMTGLNVTDVNIRIAGVNMQKGN